MKVKRILIVLGTMLLLSMVPATAVWADVGSTFTKDTSEGHTLTYRILTEDTLSNTGTVQVGNLGEPAISGSGSGSLTIPETVEDGGITYTVTSIGNYAFRECIGFTDNLTIPDSVISIGSAAFTSCNFTGGLTIPDSVISIGSAAFESCNNFTGGLTIPDSVTSIGEFAFVLCDGFDGGLTIGNNVQTIGNSAFNNCTGFTGSLTIPNSVQTIGDHAFYFCCGFSGGLSIPGNVETIDDEAFMNCYGFTGLTIEDGVQTIGQSAFQSCSGFTGDLTIPDSITSIGDYAFFANSSLDNVRFLGNKPNPFGSRVFDECKSGLTLYYTQGNLNWDEYSYDGSNIINIEASIVPNITTTTLPGVTVRVEYEYRLYAMGSVPIVWTLSGGSLPNGVDLESDGDLSGTPTTEGTFNFTVTATNASGNDTKALSITITPAGDPDDDDRDRGGSGGGSKQIESMEIKTTISGNTATVTIPKAALGTSGNGEEGAFNVSTPIASISFGTAALSTIMKSDGDIKVIAAKVDASSLTDETKQLVGDRPVFNFSVTSGNQTISQFGGNVTVSVPYTPKAGEDPDSIVIYYINSQGQPEMVSNCAYDPETGTVSFTTDHFSQYAVGYNEVSFKDVTEIAWYSDAVEFTAARGIVTGTGNGNFDPAGKLTRGQLLVMLMRAYGIEPDSDLSSNFSDAGNTYYTGYLAAAKRLGITAGIGNNLYAPDKQITRQEMFTLLYNTLLKMDALPEDTEGAAASKYSDADSVASWAKEAVEALTAADIVSGSGGKLFPKNTTSRAEMAQVIYNLLSK